MKPISEPSQGRDNAYLGWTDNQLLRRPPPSASAGDVKWATGYGLLATPGTLGNDKTIVFVDIDTMATNAPTVFNIDTSDAPTAWGSTWAVTCEGLAILEPGAYRMWAGMYYQTSTSVVVGPNFNALGFFDLSNPYLLVDFTNVRGQNLSLDFAATTEAFFNTGYSADFIYYPGSQVVTGSTPDWVIPFGIAQNTLGGGDYRVNFMIYQLPAGTVTADGDFSDITYLPAGS